MAESESSWGQRLWPAATFQFALIAGVTQLKTAANALVLSRFESQTLPYLYLVGALLTAALTLLPRPRPDSPAESPGVLTVIGGVIALGLAAGVYVGHSLPAIALYLFADAFTTFVSLRFWGRMSAAFDAREARRAFTALNGFGMGGGIIGGLLVKAMAERLGTPMVVASGAVGLLIAGAVFRFHTGVVAVPARSRHAALSAQPWLYFSQSPYAQVLGALGVAFAVLSSFVDYLFRLRVEGTLSEDGLAALFGSLQLWIGLFCVGFQLLVAQRLLGKLGLLRYLAMVPLVLGPLAAATLVTPYLWPVHLLRLVETAVSYSILPVGIQLLYAAVPDEQRESMRAAVDGLLRKGGVVLAGLLLIGAGRAATGGSMAVAVVGLSMALGVLLLRLKPAYVEALEEQVGAPPVEEEVLVGGETQKLLVDSLAAANTPERVLRAVDLMAQAEVPLRPHLPTLLGHSHERVVERGVELALQLEAHETAPTLERLVESGPRRPRDQAVWALARLSPDRADRLLPALLDSPDIGLRCAAIGALLHSQGNSEALTSLSALLARSSQAPVAERREVAKLLGRLKDGRFVQPLSRYLADPDLSVRRVSIEAVGVGGYLELAPRLLTFLTWREERRMARTALAALEDRVMPLLEVTLNNRTAPLAMRLQLPRVLRLIGTSDALHAFLFSAAQDDPFLHYRIGAEMSRLRDEHPEYTVDAERVRQALGRRREVYRSLVQSFRDLRVALGDDSLLTRAVGDRLDQSLELSFFLLGLLYTPQTMRRVHQHLVGKDPRRKAYALELMDTVVAEEDRELVMEQIEAHHRDLPPGALGRLESHLEAFVQSEDVVLRACGRHVTQRVSSLVVPSAQENDMSESTVQKMFALEGVSVFSQSDVDDIAAVAAVAREVRFRAGERIFSQGDPGDALYVIVQGLVDHFRDGEHVLRSQAKETFGDVSLLDGAPRPTDVVAVEDTRVLVIDRRDFLDLLADRPELLTGFFRAVSQQLRTLIDLPASRQSGERIEMGPSPEPMPPAATGEHPAIKP